MSCNTPPILFVPQVYEGESDCACPEGPLLIAPAGQSFDSDCACATATIVGDMLLPEATKWILPPLLYQASLPNGYQLALNPAGSTGVVVLNESAANVLESFTTPAPLDSAIAQQLATLGLLTPLHSTSLTPPHSSLLTLWLHVTARCNLRCAYCYAPKSNTDMSPAIGRAAVEAAFRSAQAHGFGGIKIKYSGGEPTLNFSTVQVVHTYAQELAIRTGMEVREVLLSNGTLLTAETLKWLYDEGIRLSISLDGIGEGHNRQRALAGGEASFPLVAESIERALALGLPPHLSITVTTRNVECLAEVAAFALERGLTFNLNFVRPTPGALDLMPTPEQLIAGVQAVLAEIERRPPPYRLIDGLLDRCDLSVPHRYPCGAGHSYLVVNPQGGVARCHMEMEKEICTVWEEDPLGAVQGAETGFRNVPVDEKEDCRDCLWRYVCAGGCPLLTRQLIGRDDVPSPYCKVYRTLLPALVRAEGLRILKTQSAM